jgi:hypothetical protein
VLITADGDVPDAVSVARKQNKDRVVLLVQGGRTWEDALARVQLQHAPPVAAASTNSGKRRQREAIEAQLQSVVEEEEKDDQAVIDETSTNKPKTSKKKQAEPEMLFGVLPKDMALPAAIGFLGVAVLAAVALTRSSSKY